MLAKQFHLARGASVKSARFPLLAFAIVSLVMVIEAPTAEAQLFRRLRERLLNPPVPAANPNPARVPRYQPQPPPAAPVTRTQANQRQQAERQQANRPNVDADSLGGSILQRGNNPSTDAMRPTLGIQAQSLGAAAPALRVMSFKEHSQADEAGLQIGDLIYGIDGKPTPTTDAITRELANKRPGQKVRLRIVRGRRIGDLDVPLVSLAGRGGPSSARPTPNQVAQQATQQPAKQSAQRARTAEAAEPSGGGKLGITIRNAEGSRGAIITGIDPNSPAELAGLKLGDRIVSVQGRMIADTPGLIREVGSHTPGTAVVVQFVRNDRLFAPRITLSDGVNRPAEEPGNSLADNKDNKDDSLLGGVGAALGGLFASDSSEEVLPAPKPAVDTTVKNRRQETKQPNNDFDALDFGDDEPIDQVNFESEIASPATKPKPALSDDPPSLKAPKAAGKTKELAELEAEIKRLEEKIKELKGQ